MSESGKESNFKKLFAVNSKPTLESFPELPNYLVWVRLVLGVGYGFWLGTAGQSRGAAGMLFGLNFIVFVPMLYCTTMLGADSESYGSKLLFSGVVNAFATLLLVWIYLYTQDHAEDEKLLAAALLNSIGGGGETNVDSVVSPDPVMEDAEF